MNDNQQPYVFISYSHMDDNIVPQYFSFLEQKGYNIIYDRSLNYGDEWDLEVKRIISNSLCKGVICMLSRYFLISSQVLKEMGYAKEVGKKYFAISLENDFIAEIAKTISKTEEKKIASDILKYFPKERLFLNGRDIERESEQLFRTLSDWGLEKHNDEIDERINDDIIIETYSTNFLDEHERLNSQQLGYYNFDIEILTPLINDSNKKDIVVLDLGCSTGIVDYTRFKNFDNIKKVIGVDYNEKDIKIAKAAHYGDKFCFYKIDLEREDVVNDLKKILKENNCSGVDLAFSTLTLHHLNNPKILLLKIFDLLNTDGKIFLRGSDDGGKICYPNDEILQEFLKGYSDLFSSVNDRYNGRKLYKLLCSSGYNNIKLHYSVVDTCEKTFKEKTNMFNTGFKFRRVRLNKLEKDNQNNIDLIRKIQDLKEMLNEIEIMFAEREFWYCNTTYIATAEV